MVTLRVQLFAINVKFVAKKAQTTVSGWDGQNILQLHCTHKIESCKIQLHLRLEFTFSHSFIFISLNISLRVVACVHPHTHRKCYYNNLVSNLQPSHI